MNSRLGILLLFCFQCLRREVVTAPFKSPISSWLFFEGRYALQKYSTIFLSYFSSNTSLSQTAKNPICSFYILSMITKIVPAFFSRSYDMFQNLQLLKKGIIAGIFVRVRAGQYVKYFGCYSLLRSRFLSLSYLVLQAKLIIKIEEAFQLRQQSIPIAYIFWFWAD